MKKTALFILILLSPVLLSSADKILFTRLSIEHGLSQSIVYSLAQDKRGLMWIGTEDGLNSFDGYSFKHYTREENKNSLSHDNIYSCSIDDSGIMWLGTFHGGLNRLNVSAETFSAFRAAKEGQGLSSDIVYSVKPENPDKIWVACSNGLVLFEPSVKNFTTFLKTLTVRTIFINSDSDIVTGTSKGLFLKKAGSSEFKNINHLFNRTDPPDIFSICADSSGRLLAGSTEGLFIIDLKNSSCINMNTKNSLLPDNKIWSLLRDKDNTIWAGSEKGLCRINLKTRSVSVFTHAETDENSLSNNSVRALFQDISGLIWAGTYGGGVNYFDPKADQFKNHIPGLNKPGAASLNIVWAIYEDQMGNIWYGSQGGGLTSYNRETERETSFLYNPDKSSSISSNQVRVIEPLDKNHLWIGTNGGGVCKFNMISGKSERIFHKSESENSLSRSFIRSLLNEDGILWIGTYGQGLNRYDYRKKKFTFFTSENSALSNNVIRAVKRDESGELLIGTYGGGLNIFNEQSKTFTVYNSKNSMLNDFIFAIHTDQNKNIWLATENGIYIYIRSRKQFIKSENPFTGRSSMTYSILQDKNLNIWVSTNSGIFAYNPENKRYRTFTKLNGLASDEFNGGSFFKSRSGEMFFGGIKGFTSFFPEEIKTRTFSPNIILTKFKKLNKECMLKMPPDYTEHLRLSYRDYFFSFDFSSLDYAIPQKNQYAYKLENLDSDWIYTDYKNRTATYTNLSPGEYTFCVKATNSDGVWSSHVKTLKITITPPFWKTWWFRIILISALLLLIYSFYKRRENRILSRTRLETELKTAHNAQMSIMPQQDPLNTDFDASGICIPAHEVGGDFFDFLSTESSRKNFTISIGDVSGKSMNAAMTAVLASGIIFSKSYETESIRDIIEQLNNNLFYKTDKKTFTVLCLASFSRTEPVLAYINAGLPPLIIKSGNRVSVIKNKKRHYPLGIKKDIVYSPEKISIKSGDLCIFCTDGVTEAWNQNSEFYGIEKLVRVLETNNTNSLSCREVISLILSDITNFSQGRELHDDISIIAVKIR